MCVIKFSNEIEGRIKQVYTEMAYMYLFKALCIWLDYSIWIVVNYTQIVLHHLVTVVSYVNKIRMILGALTRKYSRRVNKTQGLFLFLSFLDRM